MKNCEPGSRREPACRACDRGPRPLRVGACLASGTDVGDAGDDGLAASTGARGPEGLVSSLTGKSARDSRDLVTVGRLLDAPPVWLTDVAAGVASGEVSVGAAAAIVTGLGDPTPSLGAD